MLYERLLEGLKSHKEELEMLILQNQIEDLGAYRYLTGRLRGVSDSIDICREILKRSNDE